MSIVIRDPFFLKVAVPSWGEAHKAASLCNRAPRSIKNNGWLVIINDRKEVVGVVTSLGKIVQLRLDYEKPGVKEALKEFLK